MLMGHAAEMLREHVPPGKEGGENTWNYTFSDVGPEFPSIVPDRTTAWYVGRFTTTDIMEDFMERLDKCAEGAAIATGTSVSKELVTAIHERIPNSAISKIMHDNYKEIGALSFTSEEIQFCNTVAKNGGSKAEGIAGDVMPLEEGYSAVTDVSEFTWFAPTASACVALAPNAGVHNWMMTAFSGTSTGKKALLHAGKLMAVSCVDLITEPALITEIKTEHARRTQGKVYKSLIKGLKPALDINRQTMERYRKI